MISSIPGKYPTFSNIYLVQNKKRVQTFNSRWKLWPTSSQANWCTLYEKQIFKKSFGIVFFLKYIVSWTKIKKHILAKQNLFHSKTLWLSDTCSKQKCKHYKNDTPNTMDMYTTTHNTRTGITRIFFQQFQSHSFEHFKFLNYNIHDKICIFL